MIEIYWDDLTPEKRAEILEKLGENCNWDVIPLAVIEVEPLAVIEVEEEN